ncbi:MAG TPA: hypothetical protein VF085_07510 [Solirubrobacterales bacterium]
MSATGFSKTQERLGSAVLAAAIAVFGFIAVEQASGGELRAGSSSAPVASASSLKACKRPLGYAPKNGGFGLIIEKMHVQRIGCEKAAMIGGAYIAGDPVPAGWHCRQATRTSCRYRHSRRKFRFQFGGDAG